MSNDKTKEAFEIMSGRKMNCAQAVVNAFYEDYGLAANLALSLAQGFGGGMGHTGGTCGAVSGAGTGAKDHVGKSAQKH